MSLCHKERTMRRTIAFASIITALLGSATAGRAADYTIDPTHSHILFTIDHLQDTVRSAEPNPQQHSSVAPQACVNLAEI